MAARDLTAAELRATLHYDPATGVFTRLAITNPNQHIGQVVGNTNAAGYRRIGIGRTLYGAHRLAFLYMTGAWPTGEVDHINGDPSDNRFANLRDVPKALNQQNLQRAKRQNSSGYLGVHVRKEGGFRARIWDGRRLRFLGTFDTAEEAHEAYVAAKRRLHEGCTL